MINTKQLITLISLTIFPLSSFAAPDPITDFFAISAYLGARYGEDFEDKETGETADISNDFAQALALSWYYGHNTEGELFYSNSKQNISMSEKNVSTDIYIGYLHFGGRIKFFNESPLSSSLGLGIGATFFVADESQYDKDMALSGSITGGLRYILSEQWAVKADLRVYATLIENNSSLLCHDNECIIQLDGEVYMQADLLLGIEYKF